MLRRLHVMDYDPVLWIQWYGIINHNIGQDVITAIQEC